ncbi:glycosyltransferase [Gramella sp. BOM4]|nr:glycosyltransferase [Christiangramia bathymodioli]
MKISIITVVYNNVDTISDCIQSVLNQTYQNIELIIIDGASTDGTQKEIEKYCHKLGYYISEKDKGIFDAYNKGIQRATGDVIGILNSDDLLFENNTIARIAHAFHKSKADLVYGHGMYIGKRNSKLIKRIYSCNKFRKGFLKYGWIPLHPTIYVKKEVYQKHGLYSLDYSIASDYDMSLRWFQDDELKKEFLNQWIVKMRMGGKSTTLNLQKRKSTEDLDIIKKHKLAGVFTLVCKIGRKIPQYIQPRILTPEAMLRSTIIGSTERIRP